jgi:hypothetical protein
MEVLRKVPLFSGLGESDLAAFADLTRERSYPKGSVIVFEDDPGDALFLVAAGQVKVVLIAEDGREVILSVLGEGSFFGEMAVIDEEPRSAHVIAMEEISWGQRQLGIETPSSIADMNYKGELNFHNISSLPLHEAFIAVGFYGAFSRLIATPLLSQRFPKFVDLVTPPYTLFLFFFG